MDNIPIVVSFFAGIVSFLSPCVLPLIPAFLAHLVGMSLRETVNRRREMFLGSVFFVLGFSVVFAAAGVLLNSVLASAAYSTQQWLSRIGGAFIIIFGLHLSGLLRIPFLDREAKFEVPRTVKAKYGASFLFGASFAAGWTPCVGPVLGSVLAISASAPGTAFFALIAYSVGLGIPFLLVGLFASRADALFSRYASVAGYINVAFGVVLILIGILAFTGNLALIANFEIINQWLLR
ncbi:MAG: cytochrome c biogenesis protein CcdA [Patescibacteria group bacterium]|nr:cytochrome c biogenesis protein CcdA [Patescibacteria group bacterium]